MRVKLKPREIVPTIPHMLGDFEVFEVSQVGTQCAVKAIED